MSVSLILPDWPAPASVFAAATTRQGGVSGGSYASLNLGAHVGDDTAAVMENRRLLRAAAELPGEPGWLRQVHGTGVVVLGVDDEDEAGREADAAVSRVAGIVCAVLTADCLPILLCTTDGSAVAAVHAGWRGMAAGVIEAALEVLPAGAGNTLAWLGPAISQVAYEVGDEVRQAFADSDPGAKACFERNERGRWQADLYGLARRRLQAAGVARVYGGGFCTATDAARFFSHRRDGRCGRSASVICRRV